MEKKVLILSLMGAVSFILAFSITMAATTRTDLSPTDLPEGVCNTLEYSSPSALSMVFIASREDAEEYKNHLIAEPPYDSHSFNFYYIDNLNPENFCTSYKGIAVLCYSAELLKSAAVCPHNAIIVPIDRPSNIRSSMYKNVLSINKNHPAREVLRHELGHLFGLAEEYTPAAPPKGQLNCKSSCDDFDAPIEGCFEGCSQGTLMRSIDEGVMRTLSTSRYGPYDEHLIHARLNTLSGPSTLIAGKAIDDVVCNEELLLVEVDARASSWDVVSLEPYNGCLPGKTSFEYSVRVNGETSFESSLKDNFLFTDSPGEETIEGETYEEGRFWVSVPASEGTLEISDDENNLLLQTELPAQGGLPCRID